nr:hypothetical protein [Steroidobacter cummioxidans]
MKATRGSAFGLGGVEGCNLRDATAMNYAMMSSPRQIATHSGDCVIADGDKDRIASIEDEVWLQHHLGSGGLLMQQLSRFWGSTVNGND